jgi:hypothetical protein
LTFAYFNVKTLLLTQLIEIGIQMSLITTHTASNDQIIALSRVYYEQLDQNRPQYVDQVDQDLLAQFPDKIETYFVSNSDLLNQVATPKNLFSFVLDLTVFSSNISLELVSTIDPSSANNLVEITGDPEVAKFIFGEFTLEKLLTMIKQSIENLSSFDLNVLNKVQFSQMQLDSPYIEGQTIYEILSYSPNAFKVSA